MNPSRLFRFRVKTDWQFQIQAARLAVDWVIAVYFLIPLAILAVYQYAAWWRGDLEWIRGLPFGLAALLLGLVVQTGALRAFVEEADQLFLGQRADWMDKLRQFGLRYSLFLSWTVSVAVSLWLLPVWLNLFHQSLLWATGYALFLAGSRSVLAFLRFRAATSLFGWRSAVARAGLFLVAWLLFTFLSIWAEAQWWRPAALAAVLMACLIPLIRHRLSAPVRLLAEARYEAEQRQKLLSLVLSANGSRLRKPKLSLNRPVAFPRSGRLFRRRSGGNALTEAALKGFLRSGSAVMAYIRLLGLGLAAIALTPGWIKWLLVAALGCLAALYARSHWKDVRQEEFIRWLPWTVGDLSDAARQTIFLLCLPLLLAAAGLAAIQLLHGWSALAAIPAACIIGYILAAAFAFG